MLPPAGQGHLCPDPHPLRPGVPCPKLGSCSPYPSQVLLRLCEASVLPYPGLAVCPLKTVGSLPGTGQLVIPDLEAQYKQVWGEGSMRYYRCSGCEGPIQVVSRLGGPLPGTEVSTGWAGPLVGHLCTHPRPWAEWAGGARPGRQEAGHLFPGFRVLRPQGLRLPSPESAAAGKAWLCRGRWRAAM